MSKVEIETRPNGQEQQTEDWVKVISDGLKISPMEAGRRIARNNLLPIKERVHLSTAEEFEDGSRAIHFEGIDEVVYPRFNANAVLLAQASPHYEGPRGPRPSLVSWINVLRISNIPTEKITGEYSRLHRFSGSVNNFLLDRKLTASNPGVFPGIVEFGIPDIRSGIYIPSHIDKATAQALGIAYGLGQLNRTSIVMKVSEKKKRLLQVATQAFEQAFNFSPEPTIRVYKHVFSFKSNKEHDSYFTQFSSKAVASYLVGICEFPVSREEKRQKGIPEVILKLGDRKLDKNSLDEFIRFYIAAALVFSSPNGVSRINSVSRPFLEDLKKILEARITTKIRIRKSEQSESYTLEMGVLPSMELYLLGFFDANPETREKAKVYFEQKLGRVGRSYLRKHL